MLLPIITYLVVKKVKTFDNVRDPFCALYTPTQEDQHRKKCYWNICILAKLVQWNQDLQLQMVRDLKEVT